MQFVSHLKPNLQAKELAFWSITSSRAVSSNSRCFLEKSRHSVFWWINRYSSSTVRGKSNNGPHKNNKSSHKLQLQRGPAIYPHALSCGGGTQTGKLQGRTSRCFSAFPEATDLFIPADQPVVQFLKRVHVMKNPEVQPHMGFVLCDTPGI